MPSGCVFMPLDSVLVLSGSEFKITPNVLLVDASQKNLTAHKKVVELEYMDHLRGAGLTIGATSTVVFWYVIRRINDNVIVQRNDGSPRPVRRSVRSVNGGRSMLLSRPL